MSNELIFTLQQYGQLEAELHTLEVDTFEIEDIRDVDQNALSGTCSSSSSTCSSCSSTGGTVISSPGGD